MTPEQIDTVVKSVVADLVNFAVYEVGDHAYTPSVSKSMRTLMRNFAQEDVKSSRSVVLLFRLLIPFGNNDVISPILVYANETSIITSITFL